MLVYICACVAAHARNVVKFKTVPISVSPNIVRTETNYPTIVYAGCSSRRRGPRALRWRRRSRSRRQRNRKAPSPLAHDLNQSVSPRSILCTVCPSAVVHLPLNIIIVILVASADTHASKIYQPV